MYHVSCNKAQLIKLKSLPLTTDSFVEYVQRAHQQIAMLNDSLSPYPPQMDPVHYGWSCGENGSTRESHRSCYLLLNVSHNYFR